MFLAPAGRWPATTSGPSAQDAQTTSTRRPCASCQTTSCWPPCWDTSVAGLGGVVLGNGWVWWACHACCLFGRVASLLLRVGGAVPLSIPVPQENLIRPDTGVKLRRLEWASGLVGLRTRPGLVAGLGFSDIRLRLHNSSVQHRLRTQMSSRAHVVSAAPSPSRNSTCAIIVATDPNIMSTAAPSPAAHMETFSRGFSYHRKPHPLRLSPSTCSCSSGMRHFYNIMSSGIVLHNHHSNSLS